jgi:ADP-ribose pyrophosphatase YjhB (NUDIX family)
MPVADVPLAQVGAFGDPGRDPRGHTITVAYMAFVGGKDCGGAPLGVEGLSSGASTEMTAVACAVRAGDDAADARWFAFGR